MVEDIRETEEFLRQKKSANAKQRAWEAAQLRAQEEQREAAEAALAEEELRQKSWADSVARDREAQEAAEEAVTEEVAAEAPPEEEVDA